MMNMRDWFPKIAAGGIVAIFVGGGIWWVVGEIREMARFQDVNAPENKSIVLTAGRDFEVLNDREVRGLPDGEVFAYFKDLASGFGHTEVSLTSNVALAKEAVSKETTIVVEGGSVVKNNFALSGVDVVTEYARKGSGSSVKTTGDNEQVKQTVTLKNSRNEEQTTDVRVRTVIDTNSVTYEGQDFPIDSKPRVFEARLEEAPISQSASKDTSKGDMEKLQKFDRYTMPVYRGTSLSFEARGRRHVYDWSDAVSFHPQVLLYRENGKSYLELSVKAVPLPANSETVIDPIFSINNSGDVDIRYDGALTGGVPYLGTLVRTGDVNGDSIDDLIVSSTESVVGQGPSGGVVYIVFGGLGFATGDNAISVSTNYNIRLDGKSIRTPPANSAQFGTWNIFTGDVNADGLGDLIVPASYATINNSPYTGEVFVYFSTLLDDVGVTTGNNWDMGDPRRFNIRYQGSDLAGIAIQLGSIQPDASEGLQASDGVIIGDINGDGNRDLLLTTLGNNANNNNPTVYVLDSGLLANFGTTTGNVVDDIDSSSRYTVKLQHTSGYFARGLLLADVNGDSFGDLIVGDYSASAVGSFTGSVYVYFSTLLDNYNGSVGNSLSMSSGSSYNIRYTGAVNFDNLTESYAMTAGDVNGDAKPDLILGARLADNNSRSSSGSAYVIFSTLIDDVGATTGNNKPLSTATNYNIRYDGPVAGDNVGNQIHSGDLNGDGLGDLMVSLGGARNSYVMFSTLIDDVGTSTGNNKDLTTTTNWNIKYTYTSFGNYPNFLLRRDINGDTLSDLVISGASVYVLFSTLVDDVGVTTGNTIDVTNVANFNIRYDWAGGASDLCALSDFSEPLASDFNNDGARDLVLASACVDIGGDTDAGSAYVAFSTLIDDVGTSTGNVKDLGTGSNYSTRFSGSALPDRLGQNTAGGVETNLRVGDINADGADDMVVIASMSQSVYVIFGGSGITRGTKNLATTSNWNIRYDFSTFVQGMPFLIEDMNGDGNKDLLLGKYLLFSTLIDDVGTSTGNVKDITAAGNYNIRFDTWSQTGFGAGDVNGDGKPDLLLGESSVASGGSVYVLFSTLIDDVGTSTGNNKDLATTTNWNIRYDENSGSTGTMGFISTETGDVNGDGLADLTLSSTELGSIFVLFSTLIDDVGGTTGNVLDLATATNWNIRYDETASGAYRYNHEMHPILMGNDINGDSNGDLVICDGGDISGGTVGKTYVLFSTLVDDVGVTTGNVKVLSTGTNFNIRYAPTVSGDLGARDSRAGDVNGDGLGDLILFDNGGDNGSNAGAFYVIFSTLIDDVGGTTGNNKDFGTTTNWNIRYEGSTGNFGVNGDTASARIFDANGDSLTDLVLGIPLEDIDPPVGTTNSESGTVFSLFSTLIDDVGGTTGNVKKLSTSTNWSVRYNGGQYETLGWLNGFASGDINDDGKMDLVMLAPFANNGGTASGSVIVAFGKSEYFPTHQFRVDGKAVFDGSVRFGP